MYRIRASTSLASRCLASLSCCRVFCHVPCCMAFLVSYFFLALVHTKYFEIFFLFFSFISSFSLPFLCFLFSFFLFFGSSSCSFVPTPFLPLRTSFPLVRFQIFVNVTSSPYPSSPLPVSYSFPLHSFTGEHPGPCSISCDDHDVGHPGRRVSPIALLDVPDFRDGHGPRKS